MRVLIADDSNIIRERLKLLLSEVEGIEVVGEAKDVEETVRSVEMHMPELLILDLRMPGGSGLEALRRIKESGSPARIIVFTNYDVEQYRKTCLELGAELFLNKSFEFSELLDALRKYSSESGKGGHHV